MGVVRPDGDLVGAVLGPIGGHLAGLRPARWDGSSSYVDCAGWRYGDISPRIGANKPTGHSRRPLLSLATAVLIWAGHRYWVAM